MNPGTVAAINLLLNVLSTATTAMATAQSISAVISKAQSEKRDVTIEELQEIVGTDTAALAALDTAIAKAN